MGLDFSDCYFSRALVLSCGQTERITQNHTHTDVAKRITHATFVGVSNRHTSWYTFRLQNDL